MAFLLLYRSNIQILNQNRDVVGAVLRFYVFGKAGINSFIIISYNYKSEGKDGQVAQGMNRNRNQKIFLDFICNRKQDPAD